MTTKEMSDILEELRRWRRHSHYVLVTVRLRCGGNMQVFLSLS